MLVLFYNNFSEINKESVTIESVLAALNYDREFQPAVVSNNYRIDRNEDEGKRVRKVLTRYFDP